MNFEKLFEPILSRLLFHANRSVKTIGFYQIKNKILSRAGEEIGYDVQHFEGKGCWTCEGTGWYKRFDWYTDRIEHEGCWSCHGTGWYKRESWVILKRIKYGKYTFHQPKNRVYEKPDLLGFGWVEGYISHNRSKCGEDAYLILKLLYSPVLTIKNLGLYGGYYSNWGRPYRFIHNVAAIIRRKSDRNSMLQDLKLSLIRKKNRLKYKIQNLNNTEELPF